ncbi:MAG: hypothetical protein Q7T82_18310 [Armatimonadota bacterium]|nr:hypothetical protein [Armatimonadota bacterium]
MKRFSWHILLAGLLIAVSAAIYAFQIISFRRSDDTLFYMLQDFAFVPIQVLLVTIIVNALLGSRERAALRKKLNMVIGAFYSEVGTHLLKDLSKFDTNVADIHPMVTFGVRWSRRDFTRARGFLREREYAIDCGGGDLKELKVFLANRRGFLLRLLENPNLLEHESFTELLWAVTHLSEELSLRSDVSALPSSDYAHLAGDIKRAYGQLLAQWLAYVEHLKAEYPYLFSVVVRTNPFDPEASPIVS